MGSCWASGPACVGFPLRFRRFLAGTSSFLYSILNKNTDTLRNQPTGVLDREGNPRKVVNCSCVVVRDWGEESQERSILLNFFQTGK